MYILRLTQDPDIALIAEEPPGGEIGWGDRLADALETEARRLRAQNVTDPTTALEG